MRVYVVAGPSGDGASVVAEALRRRGWDVDDVERNRNYGEEGVSTYARRGRQFVVVNAYTPRPNAGLERLQRAPWDLHEDPVREELFARLVTMGSGGVLLSGPPGRPSRRDSRAAAPM